MVRKRKYENDEEQELIPAVQLGQLQSNSLRKRFIGAAFFSIILFALYFWQFRSYELQPWRMGWLIFVNIIMIMADAGFSAYGGFIDDHRGGDEAEDSIHFYQSEKAKVGGLAGLVLRNSFITFLLIILPETLLWHNHCPLFVVFRAIQLKKWLFLWLFLIFWVLSQVFSHFSQRIYLCNERIKLLKQEAGLG